MLLLLLAAACGSSSEGPAAAGDVAKGDAGSTGDAAAVPTDTGPPAKCDLGLGEPCYIDEQCQSGICLISELAPFGVCTVSCLNAPDFCETEPGTYVDGAWCVSFPEDDFRTFNHPELVRFCVPICDDLSDCAAIDPAYEICDDVLYKNNPLFPSDPMNVCQAPSATGKEPVDPFTCADWDTKNPGHASEKLLCENYCTYLSACQYYEEGHNLDCCAWYCFNGLVTDTKSKAEKEAYKDELNNYTLTFQSRRNTAIQCTQGETQFGPPDKPDQNAPAPVAGKCR